MPKGKDGKLQDDTGQDNKTEVVTTDGVTTVRVQTQGWTT